MKMSFEVTYEDGRKAQVTAGPKEFVRFERQYNVSMGSFDKGENIHMEYLYFLAWAALEHQGRQSGTFDEFLGQIDEVEDADKAEGDAVDPTYPAPSPETSAPSS